MKSFLLLLIITLCFLFDCTNSEKKSSIIKIDNSQDYSLEKPPIDIKIPDDISTSQIDLSSFISDIDFIPLETSDKCLIGTINKVLSDEGCYIIHDKRNNTIFRFNKDGKFINQIGVIGRGPHEYTESWDVSIDKIKKEISVLDLSGRKLVRYKYDGSFVGTTPMKFLYTHHEYTGNGIVFNTTGAYNKSIPSIFGYSLVFSNENQSITGQALPYDVDRKNNYVTINPLRKFSDRIYFNLAFKNEIYLIENNKVHPAFRFDFGKTGWDRSLNTDELNDQEIKELLHKYEFFNGDYVVAENYAFFQTFGRNKPGYNIYYSLSTGAMKYGYYFNDAESSHISGILFKPPQWLRFDDKFISAINPVEIIGPAKKLIETKGTFLTEKEKYILQNAKEGDNPILMVFQINKF